jgi:hypothetical protein
MKENNKIYVILLIFAIIILLLSIFLVWPLLKDIEKNSNDLISAKNNIISLSVQTKATENFKINYENYKSNLDKIEQMFVDSSNPVNFIEFLEDVAYNYQVIPQINLSSTDSQGFISLQVSSKGEFLKVLNFIKKIEVGPYLVEVQNLTIKNSNESKDEQINIFKNYPSRKVDTTFTLKAFIKK